MGGQNYITEVEGRRLKPAGRLNLRPAIINSFIYRGQAGCYRRRDSLPESNKLARLAQYIAHANGSSLEAIVDIAGEGWQMTKSAALAFVHAVSWSFDLDWHRAIFASPSSQDMT